MKINQISSVILIIFLVGCGSIQPESAPTFTPIPINIFQSTNTPEFLPTPTSTILPESTAQEITTISKDNQTIIQGFKPTIIRWLFWSEDGKTLFIGTQENGIIIYDVANKKAIANFENDLIIQNLALSPDGKTLAVVIYADDSIRLINSETGDLLNTLHITNYWPGGLAFSPDNKVLVSVNNRDGKITLWDVATGKEITQLLKGDYEISKLSFSPDGKSLMASSTDNSFIVWDTNTWKLQRTFRSDCCGFSFSPDGSKFATLSDRTNEPAVWEFNSGKKLFNLSIAQPQTTAIAYDPSGKYIAVGGANGGNTTIVNTITIYDANTGKHLRELVMGYYATAIALAFSPDGTLLASVSQDENLGEVILWDITQP